MLITTTLVVLSALYSFSVFALPIPECAQHTHLRTTSDVYYHDGLGDADWWMAPIEMVLARDRAGGESVHMSWDPEWLSSLLFWPHGLQSTKDLPDLIVERSLRAERQLHPPTTLGPDRYGYNIRPHDPSTYGGINERLRKRD